MPKYYPLFIPIRICVDHHFCFVAIPWYDRIEGLTFYLRSELPDLILIRNADYGQFSDTHTLLRLIIDELSNQSPAYRTMVIRYAEVLFISILRYYYRLQAKEAGLYLFHDEAIYRTLNFIHNHLEAELSLAQLSRYSGISRTLFIERFKKAVGTTPLRYIKSWRMTKAKQLLKHTDHQLAEIAEQIGYSSPAAFNRVFKQTQHISLRRYRLLKQAEVA